MAEDFTPKHNELSAADGRASLNLDNVRLRMWLDPKLDLSACTSFNRQSDPGAVQLELVDQSGQHLGTWPAADTFPPQVDAAAAPPAGTVAPTTTLILDLAVVAYQWSRR